MQEKNMVFLGSSWPSTGNRTIERQTNMASKASPFLCVCVGSPNIWASFSLRYSRRDWSSRMAPQSPPSWPGELVWLRIHQCGCCPMPEGSIPLHPSTSFFPSRVIPPEKTCSKPLESLSSLLLEYSPNHMFFRSLTNSCSEL